ncbi:uncharacterized protein LOC131040349 isoform X1 [Cryptomeria japonica]|uniref:uncharacterized protein LOC131040349 isoform X1 n=1 Tax=Cryptomeria japonica TaxID=3369 RepID=UPI0025ABDB97|nr:uncharacterized protein LOC131040349 isoform X1 [Cryptomeria japonica]
MDRADFMRLRFSSSVKWILTTPSTRPLPSCVGYLLHRATFKFPHTYCSRLSFAQGNVLVSTHLLLKASNDDPQSRRINYLADPHQRRSSQDKDDLPQSNIIKDDLLYLSSSPAFQGRHYQIGINQVFDKVASQSSLLHSDWSTSACPDSMYPIHQEMALTSMYLPRLSIGRIFQRRHVSK